MSINAQALWEEGQKHIVAGRYPAARAAFDSLLTAQPAHVPARLLQASVMLAQGEVRSAAEQLKFAAFTLPDDAEMISRVAAALARVGETTAALGCLRHPEVARTRSGPMLAAFAQVAQTLGRHEMALAFLDRARAAGADGVELRYARAIQLMFNGRDRDAEGEVDACLHIAPGHGRAALTRARLRRWNADENHVAALQLQLKTAPREGDEAAALEFALYKELEDLGQYDEAFSALARGNALMSARLQVHPTLDANIVNALIARFPPEAPSTHAFPGPTPIFIIGMPRSGTTLLERILASHSQVASAGELTDFPRQLRWVADRQGHTIIDVDLVAHTRGLDDALLGRRYLEQAQWRADGKGYFVDKLPANYLLAGYIARALPNAKILHMVRDPMDLCFSNYRALFGDAYAYSYDLASLAAHEKLYARLMKHWHATIPGRIHDVIYSHLVTDTEATARSLMAFCGLEFEPACLATADNAAPVATLSSRQVREPIHARSVGEWRRYERQLQPLADALGAR